MQFNEQDVAQNKQIVMLTTILQCFGLGIIFFLPYVACKDSEYAKFYANQCFLIFAGYMIGAVTSAIFVGLIISLIMFVFSIMNAINASKGIRKPIPLVGDKIVIFK